MSRPNPVNKHNHRPEGGLEKLGSFLADAHPELASRRRIDDQRIGALFDCESADMRYRGFLRVAHVLQESAPCADRQRKIVGAETSQIERTQLVGQQA